MFRAEDLEVFFRDSFVPFAQANISIANAGFLYGLGVFSGIRAHYNAERGALFLFRPQEHYRRLRNACKLCHYKRFLENYSYERFESVLRELISRNNISEDVYIRVTNWSDENKITPKFLYEDSFCAYLYPLGDYVNTKGIRCKVSSWTRVGDNSIPARSKFNGIYVNTAFAKTEALQHGYDEAIFLDSRGHVVEGSAENFFMVLNNTVITPPVTDDILEGITRMSLLQIARDKGYSVVERSIDRTELYRADEIFLSGTGAKVCPVVEVDGYGIGEGKVGPVSQVLQDTYFRAARGEVPEYESWLVKV